MLCLWGRIYFFLLYKFNKLKNYNYELFENLIDNKANLVQIKIECKEDIPIKDTDDDSHTAQLNNGNDTFEDVKEDMSNLSLTGTQLIQDLIRIAMLLASKRTKMLPRMV